MKERIRTGSKPDQNRIRNVHTMLDNDRIDPELFPAPWQSAFGGAAPAVLDRDEDEDEDFDLDDDDDDFGDEDDDFLEDDDDADDDEE